MAPIIVRPAVPGDLAAAERLWRGLQQVQGHLRILPPSRDPDVVFRDEFLRAAGRDDARWLVAEAGGEIVGMAFLHAERPSRVSDEAVLEMSRVAVDATWRGRGVGRALVRAAEDVARERGMRYLSARIFAGNHEAGAFWSAMGFESFIDTRMRRVPDGG